MHLPYNFKITPEEYLRNNAHIPFVLFSRDKLSLGELCIIGREKRGNFLVNNKCPENGFLKYALYIGSITDESCFWYHKRVLPSDTSNVFIFS